MERSFPEPEQLPLIGKSIREAVEVKNSYYDNLLALDSVYDVSIGLRETDENRQFAIKVWLERELSPDEIGTMPQELEEVPILYEVVPSWVLE